jgi:hypothetical protein
MRNIFITFYVGFLLSFANFSKADVPLAPPQDQIFCSFSGRYCLKTDVKHKLLVMIDNVPSASNKELRIAQRTFSNANRLEPGVKFPASSKELWRISMQEMQSYYEIADDGVHYVENRYGNLLDNKDSQLIVFKFYAKDVEIKALKLGAFIHDLSLLKPTVSHFSWARDGERCGFFDSNGRFVIRTIENIEFWFDVAGILLDEHPISHVSKKHLK